MNVHSIFDDARKLRTARAEQTRARCAAYHLAHRDVINARLRAFYADNKDVIIKQKQRAYKISHRDATNARQRAAYRKDQWCSWSRGEAFEILAVPHTLRYLHVLAGGAAAN